MSGLTLRQAALITGITYLLNPVTFAEGYAMPRLMVADASQTVINIVAHPHLFLSSVLSYFFSLLGDIVCAWTLYVLLAPVNRALSLLHRGCSLLLRGCVARCGCEPSSALPVASDSRALRTRERR